MNISLGLFALSLAAAVPQVQVREAPDLSYSVQVLKMNGLNWRREFFAQLQPVTTQGGASVWTADQETAEKLAEKAAQGLKAPRVTAEPMAPAHVFQRTNRKVASGVNRIANGPVDHATKVAYAPSYEEVREGFTITLSGRKIDQGVLAYVALDETSVAAVHQVSLTECVAGKECCDESCEAGPKTLASRIEVPEIAHSALAGEWLIPNDGALVVSLGVQTKADDQGKAVVIERLMLIEADSVTDGAVKKVTTAAPCPPMTTYMTALMTAKPGRVLFKLPAGGPTGEAIVFTPVQPNPTTAAATATPTTATPALAPSPEAAPKNMPAMPSRTLPQARAADGSPIALPPLPDTPAAPSSLPGSSEPCASPQAPARRVEPPTIDPESVQTGYVPPPVKAEEKEEAGASEPDDSTTTRMIHIPLNFDLKGMKVAVEIEVPQDWLFRNVGTGTVADDVPAPPAPPEQ